MDIGAILQNPNWEAKEILGLDMEHPHVTSEHVIGILKLLRLEIFVGLFLGKIRSLSSDKTSDYDSSKGSRTCGAVDVILSQLLV